MKKVFFLFAVVAVMASCGTQSAKPAEEAVETAVEETVVVDSLAVAADTVAVAVDTVAVAE